MNSKDFLVINGEQNSNDKGLYVDTPPMFRMAEQRTTTIQIAGREEDLYITRDEFEDVNYPVTAYSFTNDFDISRVYSWLRTAKTFHFNDEPRYYFRVKKLSGIVPNYSGHGKNIYTINFVVSPFRYFVNDPVIEKTSKSFIVNNAGNYYARPVYTIEGNGDITIETESEKLKIFDVDGSCVVDAERLIIYKGNNLLATEGVIPILYSGANTITLTGNVSKISIKANQRDV